MKIAVQCLYTQSWVDIAKIVVPNIVGYCRKHGYRWNISLIPEPYNAFEKIKSVQTLLEDADAVLSLDCDTLILNYNVRLEDILTANFVVAEDAHGINTGVFGVIKSDWTKSFLEYILSYEKIATCEQDVINLYREDNPDDPNFIIVPQSTFNSYLYNLYPDCLHMVGKDGDYKEGDFILHLPGVGMPERKTIMEQYKDKVIYE